MTRKEPMPRNLPRLRLSIALGAGALLLAGCAGTAPAAEPPASSSPAADGHGSVAGAAQVDEPPLQLVSIDEDGTVGVLDLLDGTAVELGEIGAPTAVATDGRYVFATTEAGVEIVDSGTWTWDHVDHFHYYRAEPRLVGTLEGSGTAAVSTGPLATAGATGIVLGADAVLLDNKALSNGEIVETLRLDAGSADGVIAPLGAGALVSEADADGRVQSLRFAPAEGDQAEAETPCVDAEDTITTRVGLVVGCADGAVLATVDRGEPVFERIPYPEGTTAERATAFDGRKGRPTVAALAGERGFWLLDTRERAWRLVETEAPLLRVAAVDDADGHVVALDAEGRVRVYLAETGAEIGASEPLLPQTLADADALAGVSLTVDAQRAYVNAPLEGVVHEIAYADGARVARSLETPTAPAFVAEVGR